MPNTADIRSRILNAASRITHDFNDTKLADLVRTIESAALRVSGGDLTTEAMVEAADMLADTRGGGRGSEPWVALVEALRSELGL